MDIMHSKTEFYTEIFENQDKATMHFVFTFLNTFLLLKTLLLSLTIKKVASMVNLKFTTQKQSKKQYKNKLLNT